MKEIVHLYVTSENRDETLYPSGNSYVLNLTQPIKDVKKVELVHVSVPNTLYNITTSDEGTIFFSNIITGQTVSDLTEYHFSEGYFTSNGIATEITNAVFLGSNVTVTYLQDEGKFLFSRPTSVGPFSMQVNNDTLAKILGLSSTGILDSSNVAVDTSLNVPIYSNNTLYLDKEFIKSDKVSNPSINDGIFLDIEELRSNFNIDAKKIIQPDGTFSSKNIMRTFGFIPLDTNSGNVKIFNEDYRYIIDYPHPIDKIEKLTINWLNKNGDKVNFNGYDDNSFILRFFTTRELFPEVEPDDGKIPEPIAIPEELEYGNRIDAKQKTIIVVSILSLILGIILLTGSRRK